MKIMVQLTLDEVALAVREYLQRKGVPIPDNQNIHWHVGGVMKISGQALTLTAQVDVYADSFGGPYRGSPTVPATPATPATPARPVRRADPCNHWAGPDGFCLACGWSAREHHKAPRPKDRGCTLSHATDMHGKDCGFCCLPCEWHEVRPA